MPKMGMSWFRVTPRMETAVMVAVALEPHLHM
jgi:hypothetical protein